MLFGSRARGDADRGSDVDLLVIEPEVDDAAKESVRLRRALRGLSIPIDVVVVDEVTAVRWRAVRGTLMSARTARDACCSSSEQSAADVRTYCPRRA